MLRSCAALALLPNRSVNPEYHGFSTVSFCVSSSRRTSEPPWLSSVALTRSVVTPGRAAYETGHGEVAAGKRAVPLERLQRIGRARRLEQAAAAEPRAQEEAIEAHERHQHATRHIGHHAKHVHRISRAPTGAMPRPAGHRARHARHRSTRATR